MDSRCRTPSFSDLPSFPVCFFFSSQDDDKKIYDRYNRYQMKLTEYKQDNDRNTVNRESHNDYIANHDGQSYIIPTGPNAVWIADSLIWDGDNLQKYDLKERNKWQVSSIFRILVRGASLP